MFWDNLKKYLDNYEWSQFYKMWFPGYENWEVNASKGFIIYKQVL